MTDFSRFIIVGCGNVGSVLAFHLALRPQTEQLILVDKDVLNESNLPYLFMTNGKFNDEEFLYTPKAYSLFSQIRKFRSDISITPLVMNYPTIELNPYMTDPRILKIDCRDSNVEQENFNLKLCNDLNYGRIIVNPNKSTMLNKVNYSQRPTQDIVHIFVTDFIKLFFYSKSININDSKSYEIFIDYNNKGRLILRTN